MAMRVDGVLGLFGESYPPIMDGVALAVQNYARELSVLGEDVLVATTNAPGAIKEDRDFALERCFSLPLYKRHPYRYPLPHTDLRFLYKLHKTDFSLIHAHAPFALGRMGVRMAKKRGIPSVATFHSKYRSDIDRVVKQPEVVDFVIKGIIDFFEAADEVWIPQASVEDTIRSYGYEGDLIVMNNGIDFGNERKHVREEKSAAKTKLGVEDTPVLLFVGQHTWEKNTRLIIEGLAAIKDQDFKMYFVGNGYAREDMIALAKQLGLADKLVFTGAIYDRAELKSYYAAADLFLFPSLYDTAGIVVQEAAALHTPSLLIKGSDAAQLIRDNTNGFLVENKTEPFARRVSTLIGDKALLQLVGAAASSTLVDTWSAVSERVLDRYCYLIDKKAGRRLR